MTLFTTRVIYFSTPLDPSRRLPFTRLPHDHGWDKADHGHISNDNSPSFILQHVASRDFGNVYRSDGVIVKTYFASCKEYLDNEVEIYRHLMQTSASRLIPTFYGQFIHRNTKVNMTSDEGPPLETFEGLTDESKYVRQTLESNQLTICRINIFKVLLEIHEAHVDFVEFEPGSIVLGDRGPIFCDFGHARLCHICPGVLECRDLLADLKTLQLDINYFISETNRVHQDQSS
jgi:hypothetical protein